MLSKNSILYQFLLIFILSILINCTNPKWEEEKQKFQTTYSAIKEYYPKEINFRDLTFAAMGKLLSSLDPHSYYLDPVSLRSLLEDQDGEFFGIGIRVTKYGKNLTVISPIKDTPAYDLGIRPGDIITQIDEKATKDLSTIQAMKLMRGKRDTTVSIKIFRKSLNKYFYFNIKRAKIPLNTISYGFLHPENEKIGYINIQTFGRYTPKEISKILNNFRKKGIKGLIIDLRNNSGGSLNSSILISDYFLKKGEKIITVKGRNIDYSLYAKKNNQFEDLKITILMNNGSASASEIVASALKDNNRSLIIGERSFGKGLVETIYKLPLASAMALTTAKYYTPNGICLQKSFKLYKNSQDLEKIDSKLRGGVIPDIHVKTSFYSGFVSQLVSQGIFFNFSLYLIKNQKKIKEDIQITPSIIELFKGFLRKNKIKFTQNDFLKHASEISYEIKRDLLSNKFSPAEGRKFFLMMDTATKKAVEYLENNI